ncbi:MAG: c-type cytochrome [Nitrospinae bacterium]|nr:c-type cytochrome [Nitrospinota bacterium]
MKSCIPSRSRSPWYAKKRFPVFSLFLCFSIAICQGTGWAHPRPGEAEKAPLATAGNRSHEGHPQDRDSLPGKGSVALGSAVYKHMCVFCHGEDGNGGGKATGYLYPWPRDFRKGVFKFHSTPSGALPLDSDVYRTIARGVPGTSMPAWGAALSEDEIWSAVKYIKSFSKRFAEEKPRSPVEIKAPAETGPETVSRGAKIYAEMRCERCHGTDLKGDGPMAEQLFDVWDHRAFVYDLTNPNTYKAGFELKDIFLTLTVGLDGTPMKSFGHLSDHERWDLASFIQSRIQMDKLQKAEYEIDLRAGKIDKPLDLDPNGPMWKDAPSNAVHLIPLSARKNPVNRIKVQSLVNADEIGIRVEWDDEVPNRSSSRHEDFKDAVAIEFALGGAVLHEHGHSEPFFGMGNRGKVVNIWQWRADWQQEIETKKKLEYATKGLDLDVMIFGGEVNPVESLNPFREVPVEELNAEGFGTLTPQPLTKQNVKGKGIWEDGKWKVVFTRSVKSLNKWDADFETKSPVLIAFAVWDGVNADRNGRKVISMWQRLNLP